MSARELAQAEDLLAETESLIAEGLGGPYAQQNLRTHRARVARLQAESDVKSPTPAPAAQPAPKPASAATQPTGTREERLARLAKAMDGDAVTLEAAIANGTTPDEFVMILLDERAVKERARAIVEA